MLKRNVKGIVMALTPKMRKFAHAVVDGMSNKDSAITAGYEEKTASQAGTRLAKNPEILAYIEKLKADKKLKQGGEKLKVEVKAEIVEVQVAEPRHEQPRSEFIGRDEIAIGSHEDPLEYLKSVWMDKGQDEELRVACAKAALPYVHGKVADKGKKQTQEDEARATAKSGGKFATRSARKANYS